MIAIASSVHSKTKTQPDCREQFLPLLPKIRVQARVAFRHMLAEAREEAVAEVIANAYVAYARLVQRGKAEAAFPTALANFAIRQFYAGRRVGTSFSIRDIFSRATQRRNGFSVVRISLNGVSGAWMDALVDDTTTPVPEQAAFRCDYPAWLRTQTPRNRRIAQALSLGYSTTEVANRFRVSPARVSQVRRQLHESWLIFHGELEAL